MIKHEIRPPGKTIVGAQVTPATSVARLADTSSVNLCDTPASAAVMTTAWLVLTAATEVVNTALLCPPVTVTLAGTVTVGLLLVNATVLPPAGAAPLSVTVQLDVPGPVTVPGVQLNVVTCS